VIKQILGLIFNLFFLVFMPCFVDAQIQNRDFGTIIVTYQIDQEKLSLDRIRFWLINEQEERTLYPKKNEYVANNQVCLERTVVIAKLPIGQYRIEFLVPNTDKTLEEPPLREIELTAGSVIKIDQTIHLRTTVPARETTEVAMNDFNAILPKKTLITKNLQPFFLPLPSGPLAIREVQFNLNVNLSARWKLMHEGQIIYSGIGSVNHLAIPPARGYYLLAEEIAGYHIQMSPSNPFDLSAGQIFFIQLEYQQETGFLEVQGNWLENEKNLFLKVIPLEHKKPLIEVKLDATGGKINWQSGPLPVSEYLAIFEVSDKTESVERQQFIIQKNRRTILKFPLKARQTVADSSGSLQITADISQAIYTLYDQSSAIYAQGQGYSYLFDYLPEGNYQIKFSSADPRLFVPPADKEISIKKMQKLEIEVEYEKMGRLTIGSNIDTFKVMIKPQDSDQPSLNKTVTNKSQNFYLSEGLYQVIFEPLEPGGVISKPYSVSIRSTAPQTIYNAYDVDSQSSLMMTKKTVKEGIEVQTNLSEATYILQKIDSDSGNKTIGQYKGKKTFIALENQENYLLIFNSIPNFSTPDPIKISYKKNERIDIAVNYNAIDSFTLIPPGKAIVGDPFSDSMENVRPAKEVDIPSFEMATYEVTNIQFADWLTQALKNKKAFWNSERVGYVTNQDGLVLCKTTEANPLSQISAQFDSTGITFVPLPGKENHPVIEVSWHGANLYCQDNGWRLPSENEWEKAAGMSIEPFERYKYGFGQNQIDRSWANYREVEAPFVTIQVLTTPIGFYDGNHFLPLKARDRSQIKTHDAKSPLGLYDMSGNVWEWVSSSDDTNIWSNKRIVKGGCYDSLEQGVRIAERLVLPPDHSDIYTGFRAARSI